MLFQYHKNMKSNLEKLLTILESINHPVLKELEPPLKREEIIRLLKFDKLGENEDLLSFFTYSGWINGSKLMDTSYVELSSFGCLLDFRSSSSLYYLTKDNKYMLKKLPLIANKKGDFIVIDLNKKSEHYGFLLSCNNGEFLFETTETSKLITIYDSLETFVQTINECYLSGAYQLNGRLLNINTEKEKEISKLYNPKSVYWK